MKTNMNASLHLKRIVGTALIGWSMAAPASKRQLLDRLNNLAGVLHCNLLLVFDISLLSSHAAHRIVKSFSPLARVEEKTHQIQPTATLEDGTELLRGERLEGGSEDIIPPAHHLINTAALTHSEDQRSLLAGPTVAHIEAATL
jgi:hypothetical protein